MSTRLKAHISIFQYVVSVFILFLYSALAFTAMHTFVRDYTYEASVLDTKETCRIIALDQAKRLLLEELGTYVESSTVVENYQLKRDQISTMTAGVVQTNILDE
jgi:hypothetical protein